MNNILESKKIDSYHNGLYCNYNDISIGLFSHSLNYGSAVIESVRFHKNNNGIFVFGIEQYIDRFLEGLNYRFYSIKESKSEIFKIIVKLLILNKKFMNPYIRVIAYIGDNSINTINTNVNLAISIIDLYISDNPLKACISSFYRANDKSNNYKLSSNYSRNIIEQISAQERGYDVVIFLGDKGEILEGLSENIFIVVNSIVYTPNSINIVDGINRRITIGFLKSLGYKVIEGDIEINFLNKVDEIFFTGSATGIRRIIQVGDNILNSNSIVYNKLKDYFLHDIFANDNVNGIKITKII